MSKKVKITIEVIDTEMKEQSLVSSFESGEIELSKLEGIDEAEEVFLSSGYVAIRQAISKHLSKVSKKK